jgi:uncharacterized membrane protein
MFENILLVITGTLVALVAGLFFGFSVAVNPGLARIKDSEYLAAMQSINRAILNPVFLLSFSAPVLLLPLITFLSWGDSTRFTLLAIASVLYIFGTFGITMRGNVPLNNQLDKFDLKHASAKAITDIRRIFEKPWNRLHTIRTFYVIAATVLLFVACLV